VFLSHPCTAVRWAFQRTRDTTPVCARLLTARLRCTRCWRRAACLWAQLHARRPLTQGPRGVRCTRSVDPLTGISRRISGQAAECAIGASRQTAGSSGGRTAFMHCLTHCLMHCVTKGSKAHRMDRRSGLRFARHLTASLTLLVSARDAHLPPPWATEWVDKAFWRFSKVVTGSAVAGCNDTGRSRYT